jgi:hypothetical protein
MERVPYYSMAFEDAGNWESLMGIKISPESNGISLHEKKGIPDPVSKIFLTTF